MDIVSKEAIEVIIELICGVVALSIFSFVILGNQVLPILERIF